uniref:Uncharacterized protein n=1 Tax=Vespula pensylvanica TaxID=30213 RepID=A0A834KVE8_VESPE|nr:hypothetical protein H0235_012603 [Vespula pensylvanica]
METIILANSEVQAVTIKTSKEIISRLDGLISLGWGITKSALQSGALIAVTLASLIVSMEPICVIGSEPPIDLQLHKRRELYRYGNFKAKFASLSLATDEKCECDKETRFILDCSVFEESCSGENNRQRLVFRPYSAEIIGVLDDRCGRLQPSQSYPPFPSYETSVRERDTVNGSSWFPVDAAEVSTAIRHCGYVGLGETTYLAGILGFSEFVHLIMMGNGWFRSICQP